MHNDFPPLHKQFISFTPENNDGPTAAVPSLSINLRAIATVRLSNDGGTVEIHLLTGETHLIGPLARPRARAVLRDILNTLGEEIINVPSGATLTSERGH